MFIVITGLDGSGTSTIARSLHNLDIGSYLLKTPSVEFSRDRDIIDSTVRNTSPNAHYLFYLASVVYASDYIKKYCDYKDKNVYCVRYLIDTVVSHRVLGVKAQLDYEKFNILKPDLTIFVKVDEHIRQTRITERGKSILDKTLDDSQTRTKFLEEFSKFSQQFIIFDNTSSDLQNNLLSFYNTYIRRKL